MHLAVFGGTFDPPHNGHLALCLFARELLSIDRIIVSVSNNPFKQIRGASDRHRKRMADLLSAELNLTGSFSEVSGWELEKQQPSYTVDLLRYIHALYPQEKLTLLVGEDSFREFDSWKDVDALYSLCDIAVFARSPLLVQDSSPDELQRKEHIKFIDFSCSMSSTAIRELVASGQSIASLVPSSVHHYINEHGLYRNSASPTSIQEP